MVIEIIGGLFVGLVVGRIWEIVKKDREIRGAIETYETLLDEKHTALMNALESIDAIETKYQNILSGTVDNPPENDVLSEPSSEDVAPKKAPVRKTRRKKDTTPTA